MYINHQNEKAWMDIKYNGIVFYNANQSLHLLKSHNDFSYTQNWNVQESMFSLHLTDLGLDFYGSKRNRTSMRLKVSK